ncbi:InlB B-repeat-containing protein [Paenibacillus pedocola]|uniref:InlB B-repeat-containing protein n=1 Tax=Paenibacillus pedocola TaxID=3242193 RepID=UPI0028779519|nr:glycoside hydrolase family 9 protein [Paenibacillus typhae]
MVNHYTRRVLAFLVTAFVFLFVLSMNSGSPAYALKERAPVPPVEKQSYAGVVDSEWLEICLVDNPYSDANVTNTDYYIIKSDDDPVFKDGIKPVLVHYRYFPEEAPFNSTLAGDFGSIQVSYRAYLKLPSSVKFKEGLNYTVTINPAVAKVNEQNTFAFKFDLEQPNLVIHSNQVGYPSEGPKIAYLSHWTGQGSVEFGAYKNFYIMDKNTGKKVFTGTVTPPNPFVLDKWTYSYIYKLDFSSFKAEGEYYLYIPGVGVSYPFKIETSIYKDKIGYTITRALFMQRDGDHGLDDPRNFTHWKRPATHTDDAIDQALFRDNGGTKEAAEAAKVDLAGGHMDAGDRGKYPYNSGYVGIDMLMGAKYFPDQVEALGESLEIPESFNGKPDYLDELVYELDWLTKAVMNTSTNGALAGYLRPQTPTDPDKGTYETGLDLKGASQRMFYNRTQGPYASETLFAAGVLAQAYNTPLMQKYYSEPGPNGGKSKVSKYLDAAVKAYKGFKVYENSTNPLWNKSYYDLSGTGDKPGVKHLWSNEMLLTASALLAAMGDQDSLDGITKDELVTRIEQEMPLNRTDYNSFKQYFWVLDRAWLGVFVSMYENPNLNEGLRNWAKGGILNYAVSELSFSDPFGASAQDKGYKNQIGWRFTSSTLMPVLVGYGVTKEQKYLDRIQKTWDYTLGSNAVSRSFITGLGDPQRAPRWFVHEMNLYQWTKYKEGKGEGWSEPPPGIPNSDIQSAPYPSWYDDKENTIAKTKVFPEYQEDYAVMYRYTDSWNTTNEYSVNILSANAASILPLIPVETVTLNVYSAEGEVVPAGGTYNKGTKLTLNAKGHLGHQFKAWKDKDGNVIGEESEITITLDMDTTLTAEYEPVNSYTVTVNAVHGKVTQENPLGQYNAGEKITLSAEAEYGYEFVGWDDLENSGPSSRDIIVDRDLNLTARFKELSKHSLKVDALDGGIMKVNPLKSSYYKGDEVILTAVDHFGYKFSKWDKDFESTLNPASVIIDRDKEITANFEEVPVYTLNAAAIEGGTVTQAAKQPANASGNRYEAGSVVTLTATTKPGYLFTGWSGDVANEKIHEIPLTVTVNADTTITANFKPANTLMSVDVTPGAVPGKTVVTNAVYTLTSSGNAFSLAPDSFRYLLRPGLKDNTVFTATLNSLTGSNPEAAAAGIQIRRDLTHNSQYAAIMVRNGKILMQVRRGGTGRDLVDLGVVGDKPVHLRIERTIYRDITLSWSTDGVEWKSAKLQTLWDWVKPEMELTIGLFVSAGAGDNTATATFSNVSWPNMYTLTVESDGLGDAGVESGLYVANSNVKLHAIARDQDKYTFTHWSGDLTGKRNPVNLSMTGDKTIKANFGPMPAACELKVSAVTGGKILLDPPLPKGGTYAPNTKVKVTALPDLGYRFIHWEGDLVGTEADTYLVMNGHKEISAKFVSYKSSDIATEYTGATTDDETGLTMTASGQNIWAGSDSFRYTYVDHLTGEADIVAQITEFNGTTDNARAGIMIRQGISAGSGYQGIFINKDRKIISQYRIGAQTVRPYVSEPVSGPIWLKVEKRGTTLRTYSSADGQTWTLRDSQTLAAFVGPFTAGLAVAAGQDSKFVTAKFGSVKWPVVQAYPLQTEAVNGTITVSPSAPAYPAGTVVTVTYAAAPGYIFTGWSGDLSGLANPATVTMDTYKTIRANFRKETDRYTLVTNSVYGVIEIDSPQESYSAGTQVTLSATPAKGYAFSGWSGDFSGTANPATVIMDDNKTITANFIRVLVPQKDYWSEDIGSITTGATMATDASIKVKGFGSNIWGQVDRFRYVYQGGIEGDSAIIAKIDGMTFSGASPHKDIKIGIMIRQNTSAGSAHQGIFINGLSELTSIHRDYAGGWAQMNQADQVTVTWPVWLKVERKGNVVKTYWSKDGAVWTERSSQTLNLTGSYTMGLAVSAGEDGKFAEAAFSNVMWPKLPAPDPSEKE